MRYFISILTILLFGSFTKTVAQFKPWEACTHSGSRFAAVPDASMPDASLNLVTVYEWVWDTTLVDRVQLDNNNGDTIDIYWKDTPKPHTRIGYVQKSAYLLPNGNGGFDRIDGCNADTAWAYVNINGVPVALDKNITEICAGNSIAFIDQIGIADSYKWKVRNDSLFTNEITINTTKADTIIKIKIIGTDTISGCFTSDSTELAVRPVPEFSIKIGGDTVKDTMICGDEQITLDAGYNTDYFYSWNGISTSSITVSALDAGSPDIIKYYPVTVSNTFGCETTDSVAIKRCVPPAAEIIPLAITPNDDGHNDTWDIPYLDFYSDASVTVYDRWSNIVYSSKGKYVAWDGKYLGKAVPMGTYFYIIQVSKTDKPFYGTVLIIR